MQGRLSGGGNDSEESDWEPEAEVMPPEREQTRSGRQRKRPSFFQVCYILYRFPIVWGFVFCMKKGFKLILFRSILKDTGTLDLKS